MADFTGIGGLPEQQQQQSLLQMAQGAAPQPQSYGTWSPASGYDVDAIVRAFSGAGGEDGGRGGSGEGFSHGLFGGAGLSPEDKARYFDASGGYKMDDPRQVAAEGGISLGQLSSGFLPRYGAGGQGYEYASDQGGFFSAEDMSRVMGRPVPGIATHGMNGLSTNNWRLLGMGPGWIMRNGSLINTRAGEVTRGGHVGSDMGGGRTAEEGMAAQSGSPLGSGAGWGTPNRWGDSFYWPGAATGGYGSRSPTGTNV